jgi:hypothetical protein
MTSPLFSSARLDTDAVNEHAVGAALARHYPDVMIAFETRMASRYARVRKRDVIRRGSSDVYRRAVLQFIETRRGAGPFND